MQYPVGETAQPFTSVDSVTFTTLGISYLVLNASGLEKVSSTNLR